jgi:hypothetical protein
VKTTIDIRYVLSCTFVPDKDCRFDWARFAVELSVESKSGEPANIEPIAYDLFPNEVLSEIKCKRDIGFSPELKLLADTIDLKADINESNEFIIYEPEITSFGINRPGIGWNFAKTKEKGVWGDKIVLLVIRAPKNSKVKGRFLLGGEVSSHISKWMLIPITKTKDTVVDAEYDLSG